MKAMILSSALVLTLTACGTTTNYTAINTSPHTLNPRTAESVEMFMKNQPSRPYVEVGVIMVLRSSGFSVASIGELTTAARAEAARRGCDAAVFRDEKKGASNPSGWNAIEYTAGVEATCVVYTNGGTSNRGGRPLRRGVRQADAPRCSSRAFHWLTAASATPSASATRRAFQPGCNNSKPLFRWASLQPCGLSSSGPIPTAYPPAVKTKVFT